MIERRYVPNTFEVRTLPNGKTQIEGHAAVFNSRSQNLGGFTEQIAVGAFDRTIGEDDIRALFNHDANFILGRNVANTLELSPDSTGLAYRISPPDTSYARDLQVSMERGDVTQSSFGFSVYPEGDEWSYDENDMPLRTLRAVKLFDVSPVTFPAYTDTDSTVAQRSLSAFLASNPAGHGNPVNLRLALDLRAKQFHGR